MNPREKLGKKPRRSPHPRLRQRKRRKSLPRRRPRKRPRRLRKKPRRPKRSPRRPPKSRQETPPLIVPGAQNWISRKFRDAITGLHCSGLPRQAPHWHDFAAAGNRSPRRPRAESVRSCAALGITRRPLPPALLIEPLSAVRINAYVASHRAHTEDARRRAIAPHEVLGRQLLCRQIPK